MKTRLTYYSVDNMITLYLLLAYNDTGRNLSVYEDFGEHLYRMTVRTSAKFTIRCRLIVLQHGARMHFLKYTKLF